MLHLIFVALVVALVWYPAGAATIVHDKDRLVLTGPIRWGDSVVFFAAVNSDRNIRTVVLDSDGGLVDEAIEIGRIIRERHLDTAVPPSSSCVSACVLVWAAGQRRTVDGQLATHCPAFQGTFQCFPPTRQLMVNFLKEMGAPEAVIELQQAAGSTSVLWVPAEFLTPSRPRHRRRSPDWLKMKNPATPWW